MGKFNVSEKDFMGQVIAIAKLHNWQVYHTHDSKRSEPGFPDLVIVKPPYCFFIECKREDGKVTPAQLIWLEALSQCYHGVQAFVWRPSEWKEIEAVLGQHQEPPQDSAGTKSRALKG